MCLSTFERCKVSINWVTVPTSTTTLRSEDLSKLRVASKKASGAEMVPIWSDRKSCGGDQYDERGSEVRFARTLRLHEVKSLLCA